MLMTGSHHLGNSQRRAGDFTAQPIRICDGVWLGARSTVLPGVTLHEGAVVGAGAIVNRDVPPNSLVAGVPARLIRDLS